MRLPDFILANTEAILVEWEAFARRVWPDRLASAGIDPSKFRDHAEDILRATIRDMRSPQTAQEGSDKSRGDGVNGEELDQVSGVHGSVRVTDGYELWAVVAEYRALRASVIRLWSESEPTPDRRDLVDLTRFNESIDQSLTEAVRSYTAVIERNRETLLSSEQSARRDAESANRAKDAFLATLSHEMRTPLNAILGWVHILRAKGCSEKLLAEGMEVIERNSNMQAQLIQDLLDVSGIVSGKMRLEMRHCDLRDSINAGVDAVRPAAMARNIDIDVQLEPRAGQAFCDSERFQQIVWNLVSNAIKFTPMGGRVQVTLVRERSDFKLSVSDNGQGIDPEMLPSVFDRFRQVDSSTRRRRGGLGLGLSIAKHLAEMHGGTIDAHSGGENQGSTFTVRIPVQAKDILESAAGLTAERPGSHEPTIDTPSTRAPVRLDGLRVLVVDDEPDARRMLSRVLEDAGANVIVAGSAEDALKEVALQAEGFDVLVSDLAMPDLDGFDLIREIRRRGHHAQQLPAIALTGYAQSLSAQEAISAGFQVHVPKPVDVPGLTATIASLSRLPG
jgi:signal transduction histidine kinase